LRATYYRIALPLKTASFFCWRTAAGGMRPDRRAGAGLSLSIVKRIVKLHEQGDKCGNRPGAGARNRFGLDEED
jgi:hypothetical protein